MERDKYKNMLSVFEKQLLFSARSIAPVADMFSSKLKKKQPQNVVVPDPDPGVSCRLKS